MTDKKIIDGITIDANPHEQETVNLIEKTCAQAMQLAQEMWGLNPPQNCHMYVMTSWWRFFFRAAPWHWKILLALTFPFWAPRAHRMWAYAAGWTQRFGTRTVIGVKPPLILEQSDISIGIRVFVEEKDMSLKLQHVSCHELIHACSAHLHLPMWLNEGIAMVTVDRYLGKTTILEDTLELLRDYQPKAPPPTYRQLSRMQGKDIVYHTTRAYWLTRYLYEQDPQFLKKVLTKRRSPEEIAGQMAEQMNVEADRFWHQIDEALVGNFYAERNDG